MSLFLELIEPKAPLFAHGCGGALYRYLNTVLYNMSSASENPRSGGRPKYASSVGTRTEMLFMRRPIG